MKLIPITMDDAPAVVAAVELSRDALRRWMPWYSDAYDLERARDWIAQSLAAADAGHGIQFAVVDDEQGFAGVIGFEDLDDQTGRAMIGYWLATPSAGRGIGRDAIAQALGWARARAGYRVIWAVVADANAASRRVLEINHFRVVHTRGIDERGDTALIYERALR